MLNAGAASAPSREEIISRLWHPPWHSPREGQEPDAGIPNRGITLVQARQRPRSEIRQMTTRVAIAKHSQECRIWVTGYFYW